MHKPEYKTVGKPSLVCAHPTYNYVLQNFLINLYQQLSGFMGMLVHSQKSSAISVNQSFIPLSHIAYINYIEFK